MHWPYTLDFSGSFFAAQTCTALLLTALVLFWPIGSILARIAVLSGVWLSTIALAVAPFAASLGYRPGPEAANQLLAIAAASGTLAALLSRRPGVAVVGLVGQVALWLVSGFVKESEPEIAALHLVWLGLMIGLLVRGCMREEPAMPALEAPEPSIEPSLLLHDTALFAIATAMAGAVCLFVLHRRDGSADEWAYTFQAAVFAKGHIYAQSPRCQPYLQNFYVFEHYGRLFSQYTPGWPFFITPFVWIGAVWLSTPIAMGLMVVGLARLTRSAARMVGPKDLPSSPRMIAAAGTWAGALAACGTTILLLSASRYPHTFVTALYAWTLEALMVVSTRGLTPARQLRWGLLLGTTAALMLATRPSDGAFLGLGIAVVFFYVLVRGWIEWRAFAWATAAFAFWSLVTLVILRVQLGRWFETGYALNATIYPWNVTRYSMPAPNQWKYGLPLATGSYCWWPCTLALGLAGLATVRGRAHSLVIAIAVGCVASLIFYEWLDSGQRTLDWGYGPRYQMPLLVPMAVGGGIALAPLGIAARARALAGRSALARGGPLALVLFAIASGWMRIVPLVWPTVSEQVHIHTALTNAIAESHLKNAIVVAQPGTTRGDPLNLTTNLPLDLYPKQDAIIAIERTPGAAECLRSAFPGRTIYRASGADDVRIAPY